MWLGVDTGMVVEAGSGSVSPRVPEVGGGCYLSVDAIFGAGLGRPVEGVAAATLEAVRERRIPVVAVDVPSGVHGDTGAVLGTAAQAELTVTFFRRKPGHVLFPGRALCGRVEVVDIGIPAAVLDDIGPTLWANRPELWAAAYPWPTYAAHKYTRGHAVVAGGAQRTGAARRSEEHTSELQSLMRTSYAVFCLKKQRKP